MGKKKDNLMPYMILEDLESHLNETQGRIQEN